MIQYSLPVLKFSQCKLQCLHLQLISCYIVFQSHALFVLAVNVVYQSAGKFNILAYHLLAVAVFKQVQVLSQGYKPLAALCRALTAYCHIALQLCHAYACIHRTAGINHLLCLQRKRVAEVGRRESLCIPEVTIHHNHIAVIRCRQRGINIRQPLAACCLYSLLSKFYISFCFLKNLATCLY